MANTIKNILEKIKADNIKFVDLRFTDTRGKEQHVTVPSHMVTENFFKEGKAFDGSSIKGWKTIDMSDMVMLPDATTAVLDPFYEEPTLIMRCNIVDPLNFQGYERDPRTIARRAEEYLHSTEIADTAYFGPEPEFFIFDEVHWKIAMHSSFYCIDSEEGAWNTDKKYEHGNHGHRPGIKGGYFPVPPVDSSQNLRSLMAVTLEEMGMTVETHHHEVATANQNEISTKFNSLVKKADEMQILKYVVHNVAHMYGKTATFMPKPLAGDNGSGMHCHQSLAKNGENLFTGNEYAGLSKTALYYIGGILKHARALNAFTNPTTNSYRRLVPGFEAPVMLAYSALNRSAAIRIPYVANPKARRIEVRFPDATANPYLAFAAMLMAGLDGIKNKILPNEPIDKDLYELSEYESSRIPTACHSLKQAIKYLEDDHEFLLAGNVFTEDMLKAYSKLLHDDVMRLSLAIHPIEFDMYYSS